MAKRLLGIIAAAAALMCACSCASGKIKINNTVKEYQTDYSEVRAEIISFSGIRDEEFEQQLNEGISKDIEGALVAFDTNAQESAGKLHMGNKCVFETDWSEKYNDKDFVSVVEERYIYMGGAHGETAWLPRNIDAAAMREIRLADLFAEEGYVNTLNRMINEEIQDNPEEYADLWEKPEIKDSNQTDFYIEDGDLVIFFQPYDLSYYARGFVEFELDLEELSGYLKEEYRRLID